MKIYPVVSNVIQVELKDGTLFELYEGGVEGLNIKALNGTLIAKELNVKTAGLDVVWEGHSISLTEVK